MWRTRKNKYLCDVIHDWDLELHIHEGFVWVRDLIVQNELKKKDGLCVCMMQVNSMHTIAQYLSFDPFVIVSPAKTRMMHFLHLYYNIHSANIDFLKSTSYTHSTWKILLWLYFLKENAIVHFSPFHCFCISCNICLKNKINQDRLLPSGSPADRAQTPQTRCTQTSLCRRTWSGCNNQFPAARKVPDHKKRLMKH